VRGVGILLRRPGTAAPGVFLGIETATIRREVHQQPERTEDAFRRFPGPMFRPCRGLLIAAIAASLGCSNELSSWRAYACGRPAFFRDVAELNPHMDRRQFSDEF